MMLGKCTKLNKDGSACSAHEWRDGLCRWHHPDLEAERTAGRRKGGRARSNAARAAKAMPEGLLSHTELQAAVGLTIQEVRSGLIEPGVANAIANLARAYASIAETAGVETLQAEVAELRDLVAARGLA